jgi:hypothetical protein
MVLGTLTITDMQDFAFQAVAVMRLLLVLPVPIGSGLLFWYYAFPLNRLLFVE